MTKHSTPRADTPPKDVSAQVLVRSASGAQVRGDVPITSRNIGEYLPSPEDANATRQAFKAAGFDVGPVVGISFSITAPIATFEQFFGATLRVQDDGTIEVAGGKPSGRADSGSYELPLSALPPPLAERVVAVTFTPPADLHDPGARKSAMF